MGKIFIPIEEVNLRKMHLQRHLSSNYSHYPLYRSYKERYNYKNIKEAIYAWDKYSNSVGSNLKQILRLIKHISENDSNQNHIDEITCIISKDIIPYLESSLFFRELIIRVKDEFELNNIVLSILEKLEIELCKISDCDRILNNYDVTTKRFNLNKIIEKNIFYEDKLENISPTIHILCELLDTFEGSMKQSFCVNTELILYAIQNYTKADDQRIIIENIIDYYLTIYRRTRTLEEFISDIKKGADASPFIDSEIVNRHLNYIKNVQNKTTLDGLDSLEKSIEELKDNDIIGCNLLSLYNDDCSLAESHKYLNEGLESLNEFGDFIDKAKEIITQVKLAPIKTVNTVKEAIRALIVPTRLQDLKKGTHNALSLIFYSAIVVPFIPIGGVLGGILGSLVSFTISKHINKEYLKDAIQEWQAHKNTVERKIKEADSNEKKQELTKYLNEVNENLAILEKKYESLKDKSVEDLKKGIEEKKEEEKPKPQMHSFFVNPLGKTTKIDLSHLQSSNTNNKKSEDDEVSAYINKIKNE